MRFLKSSNSLQVKGPAKVLGYYFLFSFLWIVSTDLLSHFFARQHGLYLHTIKGILYVCFSGTILWILTRSVVIEANRLEGTVAEIFQQSEFGVFILDERGTILDCNERCAGMLGYRTAEIVGKTEPKFIPADQNLRSPGARSGDSVYRYAHRDGHYISARVAASRTQLPSGESFIVGLLHNVTDEVNAYRVIREQETAISAMSVAVRKSEARSKLLMDTDLVGVCVASTDGGVLDANDYFLNMLGFSREELREGKVSWASSTHQDFAERDLHAIDELKITHRIVPYEKTFIAKDGSVIPVLISANFLSEDANGIMEALVSVIDLREIKKAQAELSRLAQAVESAYEAIVVTDSDFRIVYCNPAFEVLTGYERVEVEGQSLIRLLDDHSVGITGSANWKTLYEGGPWRGRIWQRRKSGSDYLEDVTVTPVRDKSGRLTNYLTIRKDVTREFALEQQLFQAQKMEAVGQLAGGIAHDLNNVLQAVQSSADLGIRRSPDADYVAKKLRDIMKASERGAAIIAQLLAFTRNDSHASKRTDLNEVVSDTARLLQRLLPAHIDFKTELSSKLHSIEADSVQISQVILNLCVNARDAMPEGGVLRVQTRNYEQGGEKGVMLSVQDNGTGIEERIKKKIFEPFFTTKPVGKGTGLGLSTVFEIVQRSGGRIAVESEPGKGSRFDVTFACVEETKEHEREAIAVSHVNEPSLQVSGSVLVCEDDATVRTVICEYLEDLGCEVIRCASASEAHITAGVKKPAILVTDVMLPGGSGVQLSKALRTTNENLKVLLITGHTESEILKTIVPDENTMFLQKPFSAASLVSKLRELQRDGRGS